MKNSICQLISYGLERNLLPERDVCYALNSICYLLDITPEFGYESVQFDGHIDDLLEAVADIRGGFETQTEKELFKSKLIDAVIDRPSAVENKFENLYEINPSDATDYLYQFAKDVNYIKERQIANNLVYDVDTEFGKIDITINLSKPEKSTAEIEALKHAKTTNWPSCFLCKEQEGLYGSLTNPDRSNHRMIRFELCDSDWYFQYSPYSYFNEHSIVLSSQHSDMKIDRTAFARLVEFVDLFPHYMIGSNADLPIVGGSMLTHDHYQTGDYVFPLFKAESQILKTIDEVEVHSVNWPLHTVKLVASDKQQVIDVADRVLQTWINYSNQQCKITANSGVRHNTITPIVRKKEDSYEMYLILRNNRTDEENPTGIFHVAAKRHHIKAENIGLIEAMGLAVLPGRLKTELADIAKLHTAGQPLTAELTKHQVMYDQLSEGTIEDKYQQLLTDAGQIFTAGLVDCGVFKYNQEAYIEFIKQLEK